MGIYLRKSVKVGPLRFNLSKSGVGVSAGIPGFRVGMGPRGNYVHMGKGGLYYRATLSSPKEISPKPIKPLLTDNHIEYQPPHSSHEPLVEIESADVSQIVDSSSKELLDELNSKRKKIRLFPAIVILSLGTLWFGNTQNWSDNTLIIAAISCIILAFAARTRDTLAKTTVLFYELDPEVESAYSSFHDAAKNLSSCSTAWHISASGKVKDKKYHAGASNLIKRSTTSIKKTEPKFVKTNIETIAISVGKQELHFFPDRVLVFEPNGVGAVGYQNLDISVYPTRFIEEDSVPKDSTVVDRTWRYVNKKGGPDKRFKDNKELPICQYEEIAFSSDSGVNEIIQLSKCGNGQEFFNAMKALAKALPNETVAA